MTLQLLHWDGYIQAHSGVILMVKPQRGSVCTSCRTAFLCLRFPPLLICSDPAGCPVLPSPAFFPLLLLPLVQSMCLPLFKPFCRSTVHTRVVLSLVRAVQTVQLWCQPLFLPCRSPLHTRLLFLLPLLVQPLPMLRKLLFLPYPSSVLHKACPFEHYHVQPQTGMIGLGTARSHLCTSGPLASLWRTTGPGSPQGLMRLGQSPSTRPGRSPARRTRLPAGRPLPGRRTTTLRPLRPQKPAQSPALPLPRCMATHPGCPTTATGTTPSSSSLG